MNCPRYSAFAQPAHPAESVKIVTLDCAASPSDIRHANGAAFSLRNHNQVRPSKVIWQRNQLRLRNLNRPRTATRQVILHVTEPKTNVSHLTKNLIKYRSSNHLQLNPSPFFLSSLFRAKRFNNCCKPQLGELPSYLRTMKYLQMEPILELVFCARTN